MQVSKGILAALRRCVFGRGIFFILSALCLCLVVLLSGVQAWGQVPDASAEIVAKKLQAAQAFKSGDYATAVGLFTVVSKLSPGDALVWLYLGQSLGQTGDNMGARQAYGKVLELQTQGDVAEQARGLLAKLPDPDLFKLKLGDGLTLGDWMLLAEQRAKSGQQQAVIGEANQYLAQFGPVPQLVRLRDELVRERKAEQARQLKETLAKIHLSDAESARQALPGIRDLRAQSS
jgi:hypothetical protein